MNANAKQAKYLIEEINSRFEKENEYENNQNNH